MSVFRPIKREYVHQYRKSCMDLNETFLDYFQMCEDCKLIMGVQDVNLAPKRPQRAKSLQPQSDRRISNLKDSRLCRKGNEGLKLEISLN